MCRQEGTEFTVIIFEWRKGEGAMGSLPGQDKNEGGQEPILLGSRDDWLFTIPPL